MIRNLGRLTSIGLLIGLLVLLPTTGQVFAQWPPFSLVLSPSYSDGIITYNVELTNSTEAELRDVTIKVPLPAGTEFIEGQSVYPGVQITYDGTEVTIFADVVHRILNNVSFSVSVQDTNIQDFATRPWVKWSGDQPGDYLADEVTVDITQTPLDWTDPFPFFSLRTSALVDGNTITYSLYPRNEGWLRIWDLKISIPLPEGTKFVSAEAPGSFTAGFDGQQAHFTTIELADDVNLEPLRLTISIDDGVGGMVVTRAWASWKNDGWGVGTDYAPEETLATGWIVVQPQVPQLVIVDSVEDVPFDYYDLTGISFQPDGDELKANFFTVGDFTAQEDPVAFNLYIDADCQAGTGDPVTEGIGAEYAVGFVPYIQESYFEVWDQQSQTWVPQEDVFIPAATGDSGNTVSLWLPLGLVRQDGQLCWAADAISWNSGNYVPYPTPDEIIYVPDAVIVPEIWWASASVGLAAPMMTDLAEEQSPVPGPLLPETGGEDGVDASSVQVPVTLTVLAIVLWQGLRAVKAPR